MLTVYCNESLASNTLKYAKSLALSILEEYAELLALNTLLIGRGYKYCTLGIVAQTLYTL